MTAGRGTTSGQGKSFSGTPTGVSSTGALLALIGSVRDLGRGSFRSASRVGYPENERRDVLLEDALDIFDRQLDHIEGWATAHSDAAGVPEKTVAPSSPVTERDEALVRAVLADAVNAANGCDGMDGAGREVEAIAAFARLVGDRDRLLTACNICEEPWPNHAQACVYLWNVKDRKAAEAECVRLLERVRQLEAELSGGEQSSPSSTGFAAQAAAFTSRLTDGGPEVPDFEVPDDPFGKEVSEPVQPDAEQSGVKATGSLTSTTGGRKLNLGAIEIRQEDEAKVAELAAAEVRLRETTNALREAEQALGAVENCLEGTVSPEACDLVNAARRTARAALGDTREEGQQSFGAAGVRAHLRYASYVARHKWFVLRAGLKTRAPLWRLLIHDWSKLTRKEWTPYVRSFYGPQPRTAETKAAFDAAWLHHQHANPHHWQHWVLREDSGKEKVLPMPEKFVREMVADWMGAGRAITGYWDVAAWYQRQARQLLLHPDTSALVIRLIATTALSGAQAPPKKPSNLAAGSGETTP